MVAFDLGDPTRFARSGLSQSGACCLELVTNLGLPFLRNILKALSELLQWGIDAVPFNSA
jgi:hypothetical protein